MVVQFHPKTVISHIILLFISREDSTNPTILAKTKPNACVDEPFGPYIAPYSTRKLRHLTHTSDSGPQSPAPHRAFAALRTPGFAIYLLGSAVAMMADSIDHVISSWMI